MALSLLFVKSKFLRLFRALNTLSEIISKKLSLRLIVSRVDAMEPNNCGSSRRLSWFLLRASVLRETKSRVRLAPNDLRAFPDRSKVSRDLRPLSRNWWTSLRELFVSFKLASDPHSLKKVAGREPMLFSLRSRDLRLHFSVRPP